MSAARAQDPPPAPKKRSVHVYVLGALAVLGLGVYLYTRPPAPVLPLRPEALDANVSAVIQRQIDAVHANPKSGESHGALGVAYEANSLWNEAVESFDNAASLSGDPVWPYRRAVALLSMGEVDEAFDGLLAITRSSPRYAPAHHQLGLLQHESGSFDEAEASFARAAELVPDSPVPLVGLAQVALARQDYGAARDHLQAALQFDPNYKMAHFLLGSAYRGLDQMEKAQRHLTLGQEPVTRFLPDRTAALRGGMIAGLASQLETAGSLLDAGRLEEGLALLEKTRSERPDDVNVLNNLSVAYQKTQQYDRALELLLRLKGIDPGNFAVLINLAECTFQMQRFEESLGYAREAVELSPLVGQAQFALGRALMRLGRLSEAYEALQVTLTLDTRSAEVYLFFAECCLGLERWEEARDSLLEVTRRVPNHLPAQLSLCKVYLRLGQRGEAQKHYERAYELAPTDERVTEMGAFLRRN